MYSLAGLEIQRFTAGFPDFLSSDKAHAVPFVVLSEITIYFKYIDKFRLEREGRD